MTDEHNLDFDRRQRLGISEAVYCGHKKPEQIAAILETTRARGESMLLTRLAPQQFEQIPGIWREALHYDGVSQTAFLGQTARKIDTPAVLIVTGGTSDVPIAREAFRTLEFHGCPAREIHDIGVAGLHRLISCKSDWAAAPIVIAIAGFEGALFSVLGGLMSGVLIAVPSSVGLGVAVGGHLAMHAAMASCAPGILTVNIDSGFGAACAALRIIQSHALATRSAEGHSTP